ncbi:3' terminal RNA ribose 2'-O-methyltransferase Hen1 [Nocardia alni]|uniref:3' terminal RNA ribose 2'-O-methyltransferase Hen1 n=1 Tax=Nocardia alni TaxID=2815723 RepID=UPI001C2329DB|nr:3' terminal RNA ribose 2'-O-methyltransferase Hen1 [Nocardia alni]
MLLTITCTRAEGADWAATDLGYLLHKNPARAQVFEQSYGSAHVLYPEATEQRCTAALLLEIDPVRLVRGRSRGTPEFSLGQYVNDRPYAATSLLSVAIAGVFKSALHGQCAQRPELAVTALPLRIELPAVPCRGGAEVAGRMFAPLGWQVSATPIPLDPAFPEWGESYYVRLELTACMRVADALSHLYVLLPVLDGSKHYWLGDDEVDKLLRAGESWLATHPERAWITRRYLARRQSLVRTALARLADIDDATPESLGAIDEVDDELRSPSLAVLRRAAVVRTLHEVGARRVLDLGCGEGTLLRELLPDKVFTEIVGVDVSMRALRIAQRRLHLDRAPRQVSERITLRQSALTYADAALRGYDAAVLMEVIEHVDPPRLAALEHTVFGAAAPGAVIVTTPNGEYNTLYETLSAGKFRHSDHRFEWSRAEFATWAQRVVETYGYSVCFEPVGPEDPAHGSSTQMAVFRKAGAR